MRRSASDRRTGQTDGRPTSLRSKTVESAPRYPLAFNEGVWNQEGRTITADEIDRLPSTFRALSASGKRAKLAGRRLFQTVLRQDDDDVTIDACIGIEALLGEQHDELVHRMGLRASVALAPSGWDPAMAYDLLKKVYGHRSKIVHGTEPANATITVAESTLAVSRVAVRLLRALLESQLNSDPPWTTSALDAQLFAALVPRTPGGSDPSK